MNHPKESQDKEDQEESDAQVYDDLFELVRHAKGLGWRDREIKNAIKEIIEVLSME